MEKQTDNILGSPLSKAFKVWWVAMGTTNGSFSENHPKGSFFNTFKAKPLQPLNTIIASGGAKITHYKYPNELSNEILSMAGTFPLDYNFMNIKPKYLIGMSVPPVMMAQISYQVYLQYLKVHNI
jgi:site-specific DNA-cytosine methylase